MKINKLYLLALVLLVFTQNQAQEKKLLTLKEAVEIAVVNSDAAQLAKTKVVSSKLALDNVKNNRYHTYILRIYLCTKSCTQTRVQKK